MLSTTRTLYKLKCILLKFLNILFTNTIWNVWLPYCGIYYIILYYISNFISVIWLDISKINSWLFTEITTSLQYTYSYNLFISISCILIHLGIFGLQMVFELIDDLVPDLLCHNWFYWYKNVSSSAKQRVL